MVLLGVIFVDIESESIFVRFRLAASTGFLKENYFAVF